MRKMAIMKGVGFGNRDVGCPVLFFTAYIDDCVGSLQVLGTDKAIEVIKKSGVSDVKDLEGKPCWMECEGNLSKFIELSTI